MNIKELFFDKSFLRFLLVGVINTIFGTTVMFVSYNVLHLGYWLSSALNYILGSILSFFLNKYYTFQNHSKTLRSAIYFTFNILVCYLIAYGVAKPFILWILSDSTQSEQENIAMILGMLLFVIINYTGQRVFVFKSIYKNEKDVT